MLTLFLLLLVDLVHGNAETNGAQQSNKDPVLFRLRSQLMEDNYDYTQSASVEKMDTALRAAPSQDPDEDRANLISKEDAKKVPDDSELSDFTVDRNVLNGYISDLQMSDDDRAVDLEDTDKEMTVVNRVADSATDSATESTLDVEETTKDEWIEVIKSFVPASPYLHGRDTTTDLPYKVLTARGPSRRSGNGGVHRYLQAELNDTVFVAPFSPGPVPLFRLPKSRRQYREDSDGDNITGEDDTPDQR